MTDSLVVCSFCDKDNSQVKNLFTTHKRVAICNECVEMCLAVIRSHDQALFDEIVAYANRDFASR
jgi:ATP-dependent protease Clp ATPase subunit